MKLAYILLSGLMLAAATQPPPPAPPAPAANPTALGNFSVSLTVRDMGPAKAFYEKLGFVQVAGDGRAWAVMKSGPTKIGLFQGMFPRNMLTFNPGWDQDGRPTGPFEDIRSLQRRFREAGLDVGAPIASARGPASFIITDPDGNPILFDQHR